MNPEIDGTSEEHCKDWVQPKYEKPDFRLEAAQIRAAILVGCLDAIAGRTVVYDGDLKKLIHSVNVK